MLARWLSQLYLALQLIPRTAALSVVGPVALMVFGYLGWTFWGAKQFDRAYYSLRLERLVVTPQPEWIKSQVVQDVFEGSKLAECSVLDRKASERIARAFHQHPWIRQVRRVQKDSSGKVQVDVEYRKPVGMVVLDPTSIAIQSSPLIRNFADPRRKHLLPIDCDGYLLPSNEQDTYDTADYLWIHVPDALPKGSAGSIFGDSRVIEAARLCHVLGPFREALGIHRVLVDRDTGLPGPSKSILELFPPEQMPNPPFRRIVWGHAPGSESENEPDSQTKLKMLVDQIRNSPGSNQTINLSSHQVIRNASR